MRIHLVAFGLLALLLLAACGSGEATVVPVAGSGASDARVFEAGQCIITLPEGGRVNAYMEATADALPVGNPMAGAIEMSQVKLLENGALFYLDRGSGLWLRLDGIDYTIEGDCAPPSP